MKKSFFVPYFEIKMGSDKPTKQDYPLPDLKKVKDHLTKKNVENYTKTGGARRAKRLPLKKVESVFV